MQLQQHVQTIDHITGVWKFSIFPKQILVDLSLAIKTLNYLPTDKPLRHLTKTIIKLNTKCQERNGA